MSKERLDSDRINYLIWRYLVESDYQETAVRLQKEWNAEDPQRLPFAPHVTNHALVDLLSKGLRYSQVESDGSSNERPLHDGATSAAALGFFGPLMPQSPPADDGHHENLDIARKRQIEPDQTQLSLAQPAKKPRLSNGYEHGADTTPMDVDEDHHHHQHQPQPQQLQHHQQPQQHQHQQHGDEHAYPSPEQLPSPIVATAGPDQATQVDKVHDLTATETTFLDLADDPSRPHNTALLQCQFHPRDPAIVAAAGTDALARMWTLSRAAPDPGLGQEEQEPQPQQQEPQQQQQQQQSQLPPSSSKIHLTFAPHHNLLDEHAPPTTIATGLAWSSDGSLLAVSSQPSEEAIAKVEFWKMDGTQFASFNSFECPVICLRWNPQNTACLALSPENGGSSTLITVMYPAADEAIGLSLPQSLDDQNLEAVWTGYEEFVLCGGDMLQAFQIADGTISSTRKYETREGHALSKVAYDWRSRFLATASETGTIDIWDHLGQSRSFNAHQGQITALEWQPLRFPNALGENLDRLLASAGEDGAISIWNARSPDVKSRCSMTMSSAVVALSFTPDGAFIAGGTVDQILIWKLDDANLPRASWMRGDDAGWQTPQSHDSSDEDQFSLCWDADGQKLGYGFNSRLAVINFRR